MSASTPVLKQFAHQASACDSLGSPFTSSLLRVLAGRLDKVGAFGRTVLEWPGDPFDDNIALRAAGALHALARSGLSPGLTSVYPPHTQSADALWAAVAGAITQNEAWLVERLASAPQTNEVARSGLLLGAMLALTRRTGLPIALHEIGASAGLNLGFDKYRYRLGGDRVWGDPAAPLTVDCEWRGTPPPDVPVSVISRQGCDLRPIDPSNPADAERLMSYIWPDQTGRLQRIGAALELAAADHRRVEAADAAQWVEREFTKSQQPGTVRVLFHTIVWQYLPAETKAHIESTLARAASAATREAPLARFGFEQDGKPGSGAMTLTLWPSGETVALGRGDFHGRWAEWQ